MSNTIPGDRRASWWPRGALICAAAALLFTGCHKVTGDAVVLGKEYIPVREVTPTPSPGESASPTPPGEEVAELAEVEIIEEEPSGKDVRGTAADPRAIDREQWLVRVRMVGDSRLVEVPVEEPRWQRLKEGDRVRVTYRLGKYTGTVWAAKME